MSWTEALVLLILLVQLPILVVGYLKTRPKRQHRRRRKPRPQPDEYPDNGHGWP